MSEKVAATFTRRPKMDGSPDSICLNCLETIQAAKDESDADYSDGRHACKPMLAAQGSGSRARAVA